MRNSNRVVVVGALVVLATLCLTPVAIGQDCSNAVTVGNFDIVAEDPVYDGTSTTFTYCATGVDGDGFHALSHWSLSLCAPDEYFVSCDSGGDGICLLDTDPHTGIDGIKFDDIEVEAGETQCFSFTLLGDWTGNVGEVSIGTKAAGDVDLGLICGPICDGCFAALNVAAPANEIPTVVAVLRHNIPPDISTNIWFRVYDEAREIVHSWVEGPVDFSYGTVYTSVGPMPELVEPLPPGDYRLMMGLVGMSGFTFEGQTFTVPAE